MAKLCLTLLCPPSVEEALIDLLLAQVGDETFVTSAAFSHGLAHARLAPSEQVLGRSASVAIQILVEPAAADALLMQLRTRFKGTGLRYWAHALALEGEIE